MDYADIDKAPEEKARGITINGTLSTRRRTVTTPTWIVLVTLTT